MAEPHRVIAPLLSAALDNALRLGDAALTGPVARGDAGTVAAHLRELADQTPDVRPTYVALARATAERALASGRLSAVRRRAAAGHPRRTQGALVTAPSTDAAPVPHAEAPVVARTRAELRRGAPRARPGRTSPS